MRLLTELYILSPGWHTYAGSRLDHYCFRALELTLPMRLCAVLSLS